MSTLHRPRANLPAAAAAAALTAAVLATASCAGGPEPTAELTRAHTLISQAEQSDAQQLASSDLETARSELRQADQDAHSQPQLAIRLAQQSSVDAELALARTRAVKAEQALRQINADTATLQSESAREHAAATPSPAPAPAGVAAAQYQ